MLKKTLITLIYLFSFISIIKAENISNYYNISFDKTIYDRLCEIYGNNYVYYLTQDEYNLIINQNLDSCEFISYEDLINSSLYDIHSTTYKVLSLIKNSDVITLKINWKKNPTVRSYDIFGVRLVGTQLNGNIYFKQTYVVSGNAYVSNSNTQKILSNGFGISFNLNTGNELESYITFQVLGSGTIYGTYQHAKSPITLNQSQNFSISSTGLGSVLSYPTSIRNLYDGMQGVNINV